MARTEQNIVHFESNRPLALALEVFDSQLLLCSTQIAQQSMCCRESWKFDMQDCLQYGSGSAGLHNQIRSKARHTGVV